MKTRCKEAPMSQVFAQTSLVLFRLRSRTRPTLILVFLNPIYTFQELIIMPTVLCIALSSLENVKMISQRSLPSSVVTSRHTESLDHCSYLPQISNVTNNYFHRLIGFRERLKRCSARRCRIRKFILYADSRNLCLGLYLTEICVWKAGEYALSLRDFFLVHILVLFEVFSNMNCLDVCSTSWFTQTRHNRLVYNCFVRKFLVPSCYWGSLCKLGSPSRKSLQACNGLRVLVLRYSRCIRNSHVGL